jgi:hypothetical protein
MRRSLAAALAAAGFLSAVPANATLIDFLATMTGSQEGSVANFWKRRAKPGKAD